ncbi:MAG: adenylosuccinate synthase [Microscillaceae bacterium]|nr:adenylosuccinate synthase [Microscillaceae bacterium]MDW8460985.1 adenylosuccinate synthase [Cytophagales bacterium]
MAVDVLLGLQWGDEGKGKIVDYLAPNYHVVARFQGGPNAGHTLEFEGKKHVLHQIPSGIFRENIQNIIGNGLVIDAIVFQKEVLSLDKYAINYRKNLFISKKAHLILPSHKLLDAALEQAKGNQKIGSTLRGIGPSYQDKIGRMGLRVGDILSPYFQQKYNQLVQNHKIWLDYLQYDSSSLQQTEPLFWEAIDFLKTLNIVDSEYLINQAINQNKKILAEGAQGSLLDIDFGSYPYVTSSNTIVAGALTGLGFAPRHVREVFGIFKAYCTRVGEGPFPTELKDETGEKLRKIGNEFGATTGRKRRCGWLDLPALKYAIMLNGVTQLFMMKVDVLNTFEQIKICTHYKLPNGEITDQIPYDIHLAIEPVYQTFEGWYTEIKHIRQFEQLPTQLLTFVQFIEQHVGIPITLISVGADRAETIFR